MKLQDIKVQIDTIAQKQLVVSVRYENTYYIISDIPAISEDRYRELFNVSFESRSVDNNVTMEPYNYLDKHLRFIQANVETLTWKEFITRMKTNYPYSGDDDFDE